MNFEKKVKSMTAKEIIMAMVNGLKDPKAEINMISFGYVDKGICYGCAALNTICNIGQYTKNDLLDAVRDDVVVNSSVIGRKNLTGTKFVSDFELSIDHLRSADVRAYNTIAYREGFAQIKSTQAYLPQLTTNNYLDNLHFYEQLANEQ